MQTLLAQLASEPGDTAANAARAAEVLERRPQADIAVFPELFLGGYGLDVEFPELALLLAPVGDAGTDDEWVDYLRHLPEPLTVTTP